MHRIMFETFHCGNDEFPEDIHLVVGKNNDATIALVGDGVSEYHSPTRPRRIVRWGYDKVDSAQLVGRTVMQYMLTAPADDSLRETLSHANRRVGIALNEHDFPLDDAAELPGLDIAAVKIQGERIEVAQCGDSLALLENVDGTFDGTSNQCFDIEMERQAVARKLRDQGVSGAALWDHPEWEKIFREHRALYKNRNVPRGNATINGQPGFDDMLFVQVLRRDQVRRMLLITDGLVEYKETEEAAILAEVLFSLCDKVGLRKIAKQKGFDRIKEATAMLITL